MQLGQVGLQVLQGSMAGCSDSSHRHVPKTLQLCGSLAMLDLLAGQKVLQPLGRTAEVLQAQAGQL